MESNEYYQELKAFKVKIAKDIRQSIRILQGIHLSLLEKLEKLDRLDADSAHKSSLLDKEFKNFDKKNRKIFQLLSQKEATQPVWTFLDDDGVYRLIEVGFMLPESESGKNSVYESKKNPNILIVCNFNLVSDFNSASKK
jgi:hypothetical protein